MGRPSFRRKRKRPLPTCQIGTVVRRRRERFYPLRVRIFSRIGSWLRARGTAETPPLTSAHATQSLTSSVTSSSAPPSTNQPPPLPQVRTLDAETLSRLPLVDAGDILDSTLEGGGSTLVPFTRACAPHVDVKARCVTVEPPNEIDDEEAPDNSSRA